MAAVHTLEGAAERAGVEPSYLSRLRELGIVPGDRDGFSDGDVRRALTAKSLEGAGIPLDVLGAAMKAGDLNLNFLDSAAYERFAGLCNETFRQVSERTGVPLELLMVIRESIGMAQPSPDDRMREDELGVLPFLEMQIAAGFRTPAIERLLRVTGDATRRISEQEAAWWRSEVIAAGDDRREERRRHRQSRVRGPDHAAVGAGDALHVPRTASARVDRQHHRRVRTGDGQGGDPQPPGTPSGDLLPGHHRVHPVHAGARRRRLGRAGRDPRAARAAELRAARRQTDQMARRRRDVLLRSTPAPACVPRWR